MASIQKLSVRGVRAFHPEEEEQVRSTGQLMSRFIINLQASISLIPPAASLIFDYHCPSMYISTGDPILLPPHHNCWCQWMREDHNHRGSQVFRNWQSPPREQVRPGFRARSQGHRPSHLQGQHQTALHQQGRLPHGRRPEYGSEAEQV